MFIVFRRIKSGMEKYVSNQLKIEVFLTSIQIVIKRQGVFGDASFN